MRLDSRTNGHINRLPSKCLEAPEYLRDNWTVYPRFDIIWKKRACIEREMPRLRVVKQLLEFQIRNVV